MAVLSDRDIMLSIYDGDIGVDPFTPDNVQSNHLDLRLGNVFRVAGPRRYLRHAHIDIQKPIPADMFDTITVEYGQPFTILPGDFIIASTIEWLAFDGELMGILTGRSSVGRLGIQVHSTAAHFDRGFHGKPILEMSLVAPWEVDLYPGMRIASMIFHRLSSLCIAPYGTREGSKYQDQTELTGLSKIHQDWNQE